MTKVIDIETDEPGDMVSVDFEDGHVEIWSRTFLLGIINIGVRHSS